jgi:hypothetical protein
MTHITIERAKLEQWLEALKKCGFRGDIEDAITAIKSALAAAKSEAICETGPVFNKLLAYVCSVPDDGVYAGELYQERHSLIDEAIEFLDAKAAAQPAQQEPVSVTYKEVADAMNSLWNGTLEQHQIAEQMANKKLYTTPPRRPWVGLTDEERKELWAAGHSDYAIDAIEAKLKEKNT